MAYTIKNSEGTTILTLSDTRVDQLTTSLSLIGKNVDSYGQYYNNNLIGLLENFASVNEPRSPLVGQLWYNKTDGRMYAYGVDSIFKPVAGAQVSSTKPTLFNQGDLWIDTTNQQLWFTPDGNDFILAAPQYSVLDGKSGWIVETIKDTTKADQLVACLYNKGTLLGIASSTAFVFDVVFNGMASVAVGFNLNTSISGIRFVGTATSADAIQGITPDLYLRNDQDGIITGSLSLLDSAGLYVGPNQDVSISVDSQNANIAHNSTNKSLRIRGVNSSVGYFTGIHLDSDNQRIGILTETPEYSLDVNGDTRISGNLYVVGATTNVESVNLQINDKNIQLGFGQVSPEDSAVEGGGITLIGATDHTITWTAAHNMAWEFSENINLPSSTSSYKINGNPVVNATSLGNIVSSAPGLTSVGVLDYLTVTNVTITGNTISTVGEDQTLYLSVVGDATIDVSGNKISNLSTCTNALDAANKKYVDDSVYLVGTKGFVFSMDVTNMVDEKIELIPFLDMMLPVTNPVEDNVFDLPNGVRARVLCSRPTITVPAHSAVVNYAVGTISGQQVVTSIATNAAISTQTAIISATSYVVQEFRVLDGVWTWYQTIA
jgi:hypothetical protein